MVEVRPTQYSIIASDSSLTIDGNNADFKFENGVVRFKETKISEKIELTVRKTGGAMTPIIEKHERDGIREE